MHNNTISFALRYRILTFYNVIVIPVDYIVISEIKGMDDLNKTEICIFASIVFLTLFFGFYPQPLLDTIDISVNNLIDNYQMDINFHLAKVKN